MSELKSYYSDSRGRTSSVSSFNGILSFRPANISRSSFASVDDSFTIAEEPSVLEESTPTIIAADEDEDDDDDSLADFAEGLGGDKEEEFSEAVPLASASPNPPWRSKSTGFVNAVSMPHEPSSVSMEDISCLPSLLATINEAVPKANITRYPSNDSGVQFAGADNDSTSSGASHENTTTTEDVKRLPPSSSNNNVDNRLSGFADEVLALLKFS